MYLPYCYAARNLASRCPEQPVRIVSRELFVTIYISPPVPSLHLLLQHQRVVADCFLIVVLVRIRPVRPTKLHWLSNTARSRIREGPHSRQATLRGCRRRSQVTVHPARSREKKRSPCTKPCFVIWTSRPFSLIISRASRELMRCV